MTARALLGLSLAQIFAALRRMHLKYVERHALMCAERARAEADNAMRVAAHYEKQAAMARSERMS